jgi:histidinol dehydrogenase
MSAKGRSQALIPERSQREGTPMSAAMSAVRVARLDTADADFEPRLARLRHWSAETDAAISGRVAAILADVRERGDAAVLECTARFDGLTAASMRELELSAADLDAALAAITPAQRRALESAAARVRAYHERQLQAVGRGFVYRDAEGSLLGQKVTPLDRVGIYVPGGKAAYPSSVLMNAIPAHVAGVPEIVMVVPTPRGERNALVLAAARLAGATRIFTIGGAQAVAALAYGTASVPRVDKITGPGNAYVAEAKRRVFGEVGIDMIAGPSEILVLADGTTPPEWVAIDLFSQAEHDELAQSILLTPDAAYLDAVQREIERLLPAMPRRDVIRASLEGRGALIRTRSMEEACELANRLAPEHLEVSSREPRRWEPLLKHAGAIFLGAYASESLGDYCAGPNHVLPTSGTARFSSPLGVYDFQKRSSLIAVSAAGAQVLGPIAAELAYGEGLPAHARAAELRLDAAAPRTVETAQAAGFHVRDVDADNCDGLIRLRVAPAQEALVSSVAVSLAQAAYRPPGRPLGLYDGEVPVGLLLLWDTRRDPDEPADELYVWRLMIDQGHQHKGYGAAAMRWVIEEARRLGVARVGLSHQDKPGHAGPFYEKLGFRYSGKIDQGEHEMLYPLNAPEGAPR